jgi:hypothetical protein
MNPHSSNSVFGRVGPWDFQFPCARIPAISTAGTPYWREVPFGMPRIPDQIMDSVFYLYPSVEAAKRGREFGGSGFFFGIPLVNDRWMLYAVTNWHVAVQGGASVMRVNCQDGTSDVFELDPSQWVFTPRWHDLAVLPVDLDQSKHRFSFIPAEMVVTPAELSVRSIGSGDDVFMLGRFVDHDGGSTNIPAARFGNISVMPQPVTQLTGATLPNYILDVHSRTGYSGSPVFVYRTPGTDFTENVGLSIGGPRSKFIMLLGVHWGQFPEIWEIKEGKRGPTPSAATVSGDEKYIAGMSGMTLATPATAILELLDLPIFKNHRAAMIEHINRTFPPAPKAEAVGEVASESGNPDHKEDFTHLLNVAAKTHKSDD